MKYRTKPVVVEAVQWTLPGPRVKGLFTGDKDHRVEGGWCGFMAPHVHSHRGDPIEVEPGDWIIKSPDGTWCAKTPEQFAATYEPADEAPERASKERAVIEAARAFLKSLEMEYGNITFSDEIMALQAALASLDASGPGEGK